MRVTAYSEDALADARTFCDRVRSALCAELGAEFAIWQPHPHWHELTPNPKSTSSVAPPAFLTAAKWEGRAADYACITRQADENSSYVAIPLDGPNYKLVLATAVIQENPATAQKLAELARRCWMLNQDLSKTRSDLEICAAQIGDDFEELTFLRHLTEQLESYDSTQTVWQVAQIVLPLLGPLIQTETLVLFPAQRPSKNSDELTVGPPAVWIGPEEVAKTTATELLEYLRDKHRQQEAVRNHFDRTPEGQHFRNVREFILSPLDRGQSTVGWLLALNRTHRRIPKPDGAQWLLSGSEFGTVEASLLGAVASMLATHARNVELIQEKEQLLVGVVRAMVSAIDAKDPYTCGHSERVALVGKRIAEELGLSDRECERLYLTGLLHDVGKIGVSDAVLRKPGKLSSEEIAEIQRHPDQGWAILKQLDQLDYVFPGVLHHHESFDGSGYPDRLAGEEIPFVARILAVADSYDAMSSDRPYRKGMPQEQVEAILRGGAGTQWDPAVVNALLRVLPEVKQICRSYKPNVAARQRAITGTVPDCS